MMMFVYGQTSS